MEEEFLEYIKNIDAKKYKDFDSFYESDEFNKIKNKEFQRNAFYYYALKFSSQENNNIGELYKDLKDILEKMQSKDYLKINDEELYITIINNYLEKIEIFNAQNRFYHNENNIYKIRDIIKLFNNHYKKKECPIEIFDSLEDFYKIILIKKEHKIPKEHQKKIERHLKEYKSLLDYLIAKINKENKKPINKENNKINILNINENKLEDINNININDIDDNKKNNINNNNLDNKNNIELNNPVNLTIFDDNNSSEDFRYIDDLLLKNQNKIKQEKKEENKMEEKRYTNSPPKKIDNGNKIVINPYKKQKEEEKEKEKEVQKKINEQINMSKNKKKLKKKKMKEKTDEKYNEFMSFAQDININDI